MGEIVGAGLLAHVPTIVLPEATRRELNEGREITLVTGLQQLRREVFEREDYDTVVVLDSHWATTVEFVVTAQDRRAGLFTSEELPRGMSRMPYDYPGDPELAANIAEFAEKHGTWITAVDDAYLPVYYATINLWKYLGEGLPDKRWVTIGVCQTGDMEDHLRLGRALADGIAATPGRRVLLIASGALSHTFWPLRELRDHESSDTRHIFTPQAREADLQRIEWFRQGRHDRVLDTMDEFWRFKPEARFFHYLMMAGALGEQACTAPGRQYGEYENSIGTGQVHLWFDRPAAGWTAPRGGGVRHDPHHHVDPHGEGF
ncbi:3,4-dihydroxyphenylacetate 2,3-dioxygenase [Streptacidiphilus melanogenes]|uniref:3,4-dihydroxyphenylacetate 2,3-dioxygenase n=1 Tax=Streptacidiphilus melanogenes TaxID=411235 RepID=UPI0005AB0BC9|nr:3,4-dihydroxyphenylacetate 2,3-dioxygenase [Streptacidiphilus melanogenes]